MSFDRLAPHYTWMETLLAGRRLQRARVAWLDALDSCERVLIAGVGHGHFLRSALRRFPGLRVTCVDASAGMLRRARRELERARLPLARVEFVHDSLPRWQPASAGYDAIVTHCFLDCFPPEELREVIAVLARGARERAQWLVTDFAVPARGLKRQRARAVHALMYAFFRRATRLRARHWTEPDALLATEGFVLAGRKTSEWGLLRADWWRRECDW